MLFLLSCYIPLLASMHIITVQEHCDGRGESEANVKGQTQAALSHITQESFFRNFHLTCTSNMKLTALLSLAAFAIAGTLPEDEDAHLSIDNMSKYEFVVCETSPSREILRCFSRVPAYLELYDKHD